MFRKITNSLRVSHWYKNMLVFLGVIFERKIFDIQTISHVLVVFILLCAISSSNYIMNDVVDKKQDKLNQIKARSVFATMNGSLATACSIGLLATGLVISTILVPEAFIFLACVSVAGQFYNFYAKRVPVLDMIVLILIYMLRIFAGYVSVQVFPAALIVLPVVLLASFLIVIKKRSTVLILGEERAVEFRKNYSFYTLKRLDTMVKVFKASLALVYLLFVAINEKFNKIVLVLTIPVVFVLLLEVPRASRKDPVNGIFLWRILSRKSVLACSATIIVLYLVDMIFL